MEQTAYGHARIWAELEAVGKMAGFYDLIVAATALERDSQVATFNRRYFDPVPELTVIEPKRPLGWLLQISISSRMLW
jgi:predicted nucleic acid-binding protein